MLYVRLWTRAKSRSSVIGILSDAHGNVFALEKGLALLGAMGVDEIVYLGDAVGYIPLGGTVKLLRSHSLVTTVLAGNHERAMTSANLSAKDDIYQLSVTRLALSLDEIRYLENLPTHFTRADVMFVHGSPADPVNGYLYPDTELAETAQRFVFCGHTHRPFVRQCGRTTYVNVGSCGMPRDDGRYGAFAVFDGSEAKIMRYLIESETQASLALYGDVVHKTVRQVFQRRADKLVGQIHE